jgi:putative transposase
MKAKKFTDEQKVQVLGELDRGTPPKELSRKHGVSEGTIYYWKKKLGGLGKSDVKKLRALEEENRKLKRVVADLLLDNTVLKDLNSKKW